MTRQDEIIELAKTLKNASGRVMLADLKETIGRCWIETQAVVLDMEARGWVHLCPEDDPQMIRDRDREASIPNSAGQPRHILFV